MPAKILSLRAEYIQLPLKNPFILSIRSTHEANVIDWRMTLDDGSESFGSCVPVQYVTGETPQSVLALVPNLESFLKGRTLDHPFELCRDIAAEFPSDPAARAGVEIAIFNAIASRERIPLRALLGTENVLLETDLTISRIPNAIEVARAAWREGFRIFKMKIGGSQAGDSAALTSDIDRILGIAAEFPEAIFRLDANQSLTVRSTLELTENLLRNDISLELIEQPVPKADLAALDEIAKLSPVPIIADEACVSPEDAERLFAETAVQGVNVKLMKSAISGTIEIMRIAKQADRKLMIGCMLENEIGMATSVALAAATDAFDFIDLDGHLLLDLAHPISLFHSAGPTLSAL
ncbi:MAG TPA: enolase C-terminal domain-like protein [Candidatus Kapabacteria bacterium]